MTAEAYGAEDAAGAGLCAFAGAQFLMEDEAAGFGGRGADWSGGTVWAEGSGRRAVDFKATRGVVQIEDDAAAGFGNHAHGLIENLAAVAVGGEDVTCGAAGVDADEHGMGAGVAGRGWQLSLIHI